MTIDWWTLGFQTVNVAILIWLLGHFFWKPVAALIAARKTAAQKLTEEAKARLGKANHALADGDTGARDPDHLAGVIFELNDGDLVRRLGGKALRG